MKKDVLKIQFIDINSSINKEDINNVLFHFSQQKITVPNFKLTIINANYINANKIALNPIKKKLRCNSLIKFEFID